MSWFKVDDCILDHPKLGALDYESLGLYVISLAYCSRHLTDGVFPRHAALNQIAMRSEAPENVSNRQVTAKYRWSKARLIAAGLWTDNGDTVTVLRYLQHNRSRSEALAAREATRVRVAQHRARNTLRVEESREPLGKTIDQLLFDAITTALSIDQYAMTGSARGEVNGCIKQLKEAGAKPEDIPGRVGVYRRKYPNAACTPSALAKHWPSLGLMVPSRRRPSVVVEPDEPVVPMTAEQLSKVRDSLRKAPDA